MSILDIAQEATDVLRLTRPVSLFLLSDEGDTTDRLILRALHQTCRDLAQLYDWQILRRTKSFWTDDVITQQALLPADFLRLIPDTVWDRDLRRAIPGPLSEAELARHLAGQMPLVTPHFSIRGGHFLIVPEPAKCGSVISMGYISNEIGKDAGGKGIARFSDDRDRPHWDEELVLLGVIYQMRKMERLDYAEDYHSYRARLQQLVAKDHGGVTLAMGGMSASADARLAKMKSAAVILGG